MNILLIAIAFGILVTVHEGGHFIAARLMGVEVEKFSIGFGPKLIGFKKGKTEYRISLIPLGGYVKMKSENPTEESKGDPGEFLSKKWYQKAFIAFSGPLANFILAIFLFVISFWVGRNYEDQFAKIGRITNPTITEFKVGDEILAVNDEDIKGWNQALNKIKIGETNTFKIERNDQVINVDYKIEDIVKFYEEVLPIAIPIVGEVAPGLPAYTAGLQPDDLILAVDSNPVDSWYDMREFIVNSHNDEVSLKIKRDDKIFEKKLQLQTNFMDSTKTKMIGVTRKLDLKFKEQYSFIEGIKYGTVYTVTFTLANYYALYKLILKPKYLKESVGGPAMLYSMSKQSAKKGIDAILVLFASVSIMLMIMNLLPIPVLDGGQIIFCFVEGLIRKPISLVIQMRLQQVGLLILLSLMIFAFYSDFSKIFKRQISISKENNVEQIAN